MSTTIYVPGDAAALALGADAVAAAITKEAARRGIAVKLVRNGSRGMVWLEPLVEVATPQGRIAYGPVGAADVPGLFAAGFVTGGSHALCHGPTEQISWLARQQRLACRRVGVVDPGSLADYQAHGGGEGLRRARTMAPAEIVRAVTESGLRGRGGAAFPAGIK
jgi:formate dehydrogenase iron-sulfur subunit